MAELESNHKWLMKSVAHERLLRTRDETLNARFQVSPVQSRYTLLRNVAITNLKRWSTLRLQVMTMTIQFKENLLSLQVTNSIFQVPAVSDFREAFYSKLERDKLFMHAQQFKNRRSGHKRTQTYEDSVSYSSADLSRAIIETEQERMLRQRGIFETVAPPNDGLPGDF